MEKLEKNQNIEDVSISKKSVCVNYVSCIKIDGVPILPPLLSESAREEMRRYRQLAIDVQNKIKRYKEYLTDYSSTDTDIPDENFSTNGSTEESTDNYYTDISVEESAKFSESCQKDVLCMLNEGDKENTDMCQNDAPFSDKSLNNVPSNRELNINVEVNGDEKTYSMQTVENVQISCSGDFTVLPQTEVVDKCDRDISKIDDKNNNNNNLSSDENYATANETLDCDKTPKKLIRSSSFILENPSPLLIAQMEKENTKEENNEKQVMVPKRKTWNTNVQTKLFPDTKQTNLNHKISSDRISTSKRTDEKKIDKKHFLSTKRRSFEEQRKLKTSPVLNRSMSKRKGWDLSNAKEKWTSIEQDIGNNINKITKKYNSLPSSAATSPSEKMFNNSQKNQIYIPTLKISTLNIDSAPSILEKSKNRPPVTPPNAIRTPDSIKYSASVPKRFLVMSTPKKKLISKETKRIRGFVTPVRTIQDLIDIPSKELSPKSASVQSTYIENIQNRNESILPYYFLPQSEKPLSENNIPRGIIPEKEEKTVRALFPENNLQINENINRILTPEKLENPLTLPVSSPKTDLKELFDKIQQIQKQQMDQLLQRQKQEQEIFLKKFAEQQTLLLSQISEAYTKPETPSISCINSEKTETELLNSSESLITECRKLLHKTSLSNQSCDNSNLNVSSQQCIYSSNDTLNDSNLTMQSDTEPSIDEITIKYQTSPNINNDYRMVTSAGFRRSLSDDSVETAAHVTNAFYNGNKMVAQIEKNITVCVDPRSVEPKNRGLKRILFPNEQQMQAANIICAAVKGYLVRRLLRSERVQNLIQTIKDTLLCAMELHHESVENIQPADIELHRRLIQQVTAACVEFHDMFFKLSTSEQMAVIAHDRERQKEKLLRPLSARSTTSLSTTTQKVLERKHKREGSADFGTHSNRSSFSRSRKSIDNGRARTRSVGPADSRQYRKTPPSSQENSLNKSLLASANKKPWR